MVYQLNTVTAACVPEGFATWADYIDVLGGQEGLMALPVFYAANQLLGSFGVLVLGLSVTGAILSGIVDFYMASTRLLFSMANHKVIPNWFGKLHPEYKTPANAILFVLAISCIAPFFGRKALGWLVDMSSVGAAIGYGYTCVASLYYQRQEKRLSPGLRGASVIGIACSCIFVVLLLVPIRMFGCSPGTESWVCLIVWTLMGIVFYAKKK